MAKFWVSGSANQIAPATATVSSEHLLGAAIGSGRMFWLTGLWVPTVTGLQVKLNICDNATGMGATGAVGATGPVIRMVVTLPSATGNATAGGPDFRQSIHAIPLPGLKFTTGCVVLCESTDVIGQGDVGGCGYEV